MPRRGPPVEGPALPGTRGVHGQQRAEAHPQCAESGEPHAPYREVGVHPIQLEADGGGGHVPVARGQRVVGP
ncbi:MAG: hypothetical protein ACK55I_22940, partial [bacterium]